MFNFKTCVPASSIRAASSTTGPLTSYKTLSNLDDFLNSRIFLPSLLLIFLLVVGAEVVCIFLLISLTISVPEIELSCLLTDIVSASEFSLLLFSNMVLFVSNIFLLLAEISVSDSTLDTPINHSSSTFKVFARNSKISVLGTVLPLTYWLTWLFPSLIPCACAARTRSICFKFCFFMAAFNRSEKTSF